MERMVNKCGVFYEKAVSFFIKKTFPTFYFLYHDSVTVASALLWQFMFHSVHGRMVFSIVNYPCHPTSIHHPTSNNPTVIMNQRNIEYSCQCLSL